MRIAIVGAGGIGGFLGGFLARAGEDVTFIARGDHLAAIRTHGLTLRSEQRGDIIVSARATDDARTVGPVDLVFFCVKSYDLETAAATARPLVGSETVVVPVQNGIDISERLVAALGTDAVLGGTTWLGGGIVSPGVVRISDRPPHVVLGDLDGVVRPRTERIAAMLENAGIRAELRPDIQVARWEKFVAICANAGISCLTRLPIGITRETPPTAAFMLGLMTEVHAVGRARGVPLADDYVERLWNEVQGLNGSVRSSMYADLLNGRRLELESLHGTVVRLGEASSVPTPMNFAVYATLKPFENGTPAVP
jgi:2-dehydropantoate 2-reductase